MPMNKKWFCRWWICVFFGVALYGAGIVWVFDWLWLNFSHCVIVNL